MQDLIKVLMVCHSSDLLLRVRGSFMVRVRLTELRFTVRVRVRCKNSASLGINERPV